MDVYSSGFVRMSTSKGAEIARLLFLLHVSIPSQMMVIKLQLQMFARTRLVVYFVITFTSLSTTLTKKYNLLLRMLCEKRNYRRTRLIFIWLNTCCEIIFMRIDTRIIRPVFHKRKLFTGYSARKLFFGTSRPSKRRTPNVKNRCSCFYSLLYPF